MRNIRLAILGLLIFSVNVPSFTYALAPNTVDSAAIINGQVMTSDIAPISVTTDKIAIGAVTDAQITGPISKSKLEQAANVIVVAKSGGDYTSIQAAINDITPTVNSRYVINVMPGTYTENITMKSYVHLKGSGRNVTFIQAANSSNSTIELNNLMDVAISNVTVSGGYYGIRNNNSSPIIMNNTVKGSLVIGIYNTTSSPKISENIVTENSISGTDCTHGGGIGNDFNSSPMITGNVISNNGCGTGGYGYGIYDYLGSPVIIGNKITGNNSSGIRNHTSASTIIGNTITGNERGIYNKYSSTSVISGNKISSNNYGICTGESSSDTITGNIITDNANYGVLLQASSTDTLTNNKITNNASSDLIITDGTCTPHISFNLYNTFQGTGAIGMYNLKSDGTAAPLQ